MYEQYKSDNRRVGSWPKSREVVYNDGYDQAISDAALAIGMSVASLKSIIFSVDSKKYKIVEGENCNELHKYNSDLQQFVKVADTEFEADEIEDAISQYELKLHYEDELIGDECNE